MEEWFDGSNGWAIPTAEEVGDPDRRDALEATALHDMFEEQVIPLFYDQDERGLPKRWLEMVKHTLVSLGPKVLATRMVQDYVARLYQGAADSSRLLTGDGMAGARELTAWKQRVRRSWNDVRIEHVEVGGVEDPPQVGGELEVLATVSLGDLDPKDVCVHAAVGRVAPSEHLVDPAFVGLVAVGGAGSDGAPARYSGTIPLERAGSCGYTVRVMPKHPLLADPAEMGLLALPDPPGGMGDGVVLR